VWWARYLLVAAGIRWKVLGSENIPPEGGFIIVANHSSALDILLIYQIIPRPFHFLAKIEHSRTPLFGVMFGHTHIPLDRNNFIQSAKAMNKASEDLKQGIPIVIFPEGTMNKTPGTLLPFKTGAFKLASESGVPIVPVAFPDHPVLLPRIYEIFYPGGGPGLSRVYIGRPIICHPSKVTWKEALNMCREFLEAKIMKDHHPS